MCKRDRHIAEPSKRSDEFTYSTQAEVCSLSKSLLVVLQWRSGINASSIETMVDPELSL
jgi:hypothetical protein